MYRTRVIPGSVGDTPRAPMRGLPIATNTNTHLLGSGAAGLSGQPQLREFHTYDGHDQRRAEPITPWCAISDPESPAAMNTCSPPGQTRGTPASVDLAAWRCVLALHCGPGVMMFPGSHGLGVRAVKRWAGTLGLEVKEEV
ncbi:unnamed protein product [Pleuronectes platessa]|uniref:Uncharacterized protein n=1 Tax=Pleuronectes platessa TaxID=8262 RepID=A0A9N7TUG7_PLEPL|nr:unnamed protein product [Pleuronectes platessa]